jgi:hypothetical protein
MCIDSNLGIAVLYGQTQQAGQPSIISTYTIKPHCLSDGISNVRAAKLTLCNRRFNSCEYACGYRLLKHLHLREVAFSLCMLHSQETFTGRSNRACITHLQRKPHIENNLPKQIAMRCALCVRFYGFTAGEWQQLVPLHMLLYDSLDRKLLSPVYA